MSEIQNFVPDAEGAGNMNRFFSPVFLATLTEEEKKTFDDFNSAVSAVQKPTVRLSCEQAGFSKNSLEGSGYKEFKQDPIFLLFLKWLSWAMHHQVEPLTGAVTGDTWKEFRREYMIKTIFFEIVESGGEEPIQGSVFQNGLSTNAVLSVKGIPAIQKTLGPTANGLIVDLEVTMFSLQLSELDGVPVAHHVSVVTSPRMTSAPLLTCGVEYSAWPFLSNVPSFLAGRPTFKNLCVGQIIGLLQFPQVPRHPRKICPERAVAWGIRKGKWRTTLHKKTMNQIRKRVSPPVYIKVDDE
jgi:hypothetical protein